MDSIGFILIMLCIGLYKIKFVKADESIVTQPGEAIVEIASDMPIGNNFDRLREDGAYTLILEELGLL